ncbi:MAG: hypothetical protein WB992_06200 [Bryobacteraceae bacterium]
MKLSLSMCGLAMAAFLPALSPASTLTWNFLNDVPTGSAGVDVGATHSFQDTQGDSTTISASLGPAAEGMSLTLFEKNGGASETGLGITQESDHEINAGQGDVLLNLNEILALNPTFISINLSSVQAGEAGFVSYGGTKDGFNVSNESANLLNLTDLAKYGGFLDVYATSGNVLVGAVTAGFASAVPEPADGALVALGLIAAGCIGRRKLANTRP